MPRERVLIIFLVILSGLLAASAVNPYDRATWFMEVAPVRKPPGDVVAPVALPN